MTYVAPFDEADAASGRVAFVSPIARAVLGLGLGDTAALTLPTGEETLEVTAMAYRADDGS